jgi:hypothetical protein
MKLSLSQQQEKTMILSRLLVATAILSLTLVPVEALAKKRPSGGSNAAPTEAQRHAAWLRGMKDCRAKYGAQLESVSVEKFYGKWSIVCNYYQ